MVNASLNWASIVGIVLAICGAGLYFLRSFKPALARDYDVFFAAIGLLCGGILFFQGWRLDPILQFGQFLLAGTTVFFAYESVRLRGVATDQARKSSYFDEFDSPPSPNVGGLNRSRWENYDQFGEPQPINRRISKRSDFEDDYSTDDQYSRSDPRAIIPEEAESRRSNFGESFAKQNTDSFPVRGKPRFNKNSEFDNSKDFGERRSSRFDKRRGSRPLANSDKRDFRGRRTQSKPNDSINSRDMNLPSRKISRGVNQNQKIEDAAFSNKKDIYSSREDILQKKNISNKDDINSGGRYSRSSDQKRSRRERRDNNSRFDD